MASIPFSRIMKAWLLVGTLDILAACIYYFISTGKSPSIIFQYIASAVLGSIAYEGGVGIMVFGLALHFTVALLFTCFFFFLVTIWPSLNRFKLLSAVVYGGFIWGFMRFMLLPLTRLSLGTVTLGDTIIDIGILIICIGLPLSFMAGPGHRPQKSMYG